MSLVSWYLHKANESELLAEAATDAVVRAGHVETKDLWLEIARAEPAKESEWRTNQLHRRRQLSKPLSSRLLH
jgi:hypothetical protein